MNDVITFNHTDEYLYFDWIEKYVIDELPTNDLWDNKATQNKLKLEQLLKEKGINKSSTKHYMSFEPNLSDSFNKIFNYFKDKTYNYNFLKLTPSYMIPLHYDCYGTFIKKYNLAEEYYENVNRTIVLLTDYSLGQVIQINNKTYTNWTKGQMYSWQGQEWHGVANFGFEDLVIMQVTWI